MRPSLSSIARCALLALTLCKVEAEDMNSTSPNCPFGLGAQDIAALSEANLEGKVALVTGGRSGLGRAISEALLARNCTVVIASRHELRNQFAVEDMAADYPAATVTYMTFDLEDFGSVRTLAAEFIAKYSRLDYYFANAGQSELIPSGDITVDGFERVFQVNYVSQFLLLHLLLPLMRNTEPSSRVILTASSTHGMACGNLGGVHAEKGEDGEQHCFDETRENSAIDVLPLDEEGFNSVEGWGCGFGPYSITKFLMIQLGQELARREKEAGSSVLVYSFAPGPINTGLLPGVFGCCIGPFDGYLGDCRLNVPYVGPTDAAGNPNPPAYTVPNFYTSKEHGTLAPVYAALMADPADSGSFLATYFQCEIGSGYVAQGITKTGQELIYNRSLTWSGLDAQMEMLETEELGSASAAPFTKLCAATLTVAVVTLVSTLLW